ncbi:RNA polymerase sigma factor [Actinocorallia longicatena]|uniref:Sigma factor-like helix-turn-helix DNA-binding protein n=1 Tax=Actinocorallia longicatena TaxID=111803 RepID=A0ABP6QE76_9ACTN
MPEGVPEEVLRAAVPKVLGALVRRFGQFDEAEDAVQEALLAASVQWPREGMPDHPEGWLVTVASRRMIDRFRAESARQRREEALAAMEPVAVPGADEGVGGGDDTLALLFLCCHPALSEPSQVALTLRAVGGLSTAEIAGAFLVPEATMAQRISRAKQKIKDAGARFDQPVTSERLGVVLHVLYLVFNEGYTASGGPELQRADLTAEALRLARTVRALLPDDGEAAGLLALMLLTDARRAARTDAEGALVPLAEQDRSRWDAAMIAEGVELVSSALTSAELGPYQLQAAIAAVHAEAPGAAETDWPQIAALYALLERLAPNPVVTLNRAVAVAMAEGPRSALELLEPLEADGRITRHHRWWAVRAHLLELAGDTVAAGEAYREAARRTTSLPERRYLTGRAAGISG